MILYRLAKQLEERDRLARSIREADGDIGRLQTAKTELDLTLLAQANKWREADQSELSLHGPD